MKTIPVILSLACSLALPAVIHADLPVTKSNRTDKAAKTKAVPVQTAPAAKRETIYITREAATGSHIPRVYRQYDGGIDSFSSLTVYDQRRLQSTGELDVASELTLLDPAINTGGHHR